MTTNDDETTVSIPRETMEQMVCPDGVTRTMYPMEKPAPRLTDAQIWAELEQELSCDVCKGMQTVTRTKEFGCWWQCDCDGPVCSSPAGTADESVACPECDGIGLAHVDVELAKYVREFAVQLPYDGSSSCRSRALAYILERIASSIASHLCDASQAAPILAAALGWKS